MYEHGHTESTAAGHESYETDVRAIWGAGAVIAGVVAATFLLIAGLMNWFEQGEPAPTVNDSSITNPEWKAPLQLEQLRERERHLMSTYQWIDQPAGVARIPVERAIAIVSANGLPTTIGSTTSTGNSGENTPQ